MVLTRRRFTVTLPTMRQDRCHEKILISVLLAPTWFFVMGPAHAADHCVREGAAGANDGSDWTNAWTSLPDDLTRGDVYYVADGSYGTAEFDDPESGEDTITIRKAVPADHGPDAGWDDSFGDGQATWNRWTLAAGHYVFDGATGGGDRRESYGFHLTPAACDFSADYHLAEFGTNPDCSHVEFRHIFFEGCGDTDPFCSNGIKSNSYLGENTGSLIAENLFYGNAVHLVLYHWHDTVVETNFFDENWSSSGCHGEQVTFGGNSDDVVYRFNTHRNSATGGLAVHEGDNNRWLVHGNIFYGGSVTMGVIGTADSGESHPDVIRNWEVHHNTVYQVTGGGHGSGFFQGECTDEAYRSAVYNNLFVNTVHPVFQSTANACVGHDYNSFHDCTWLGTGAEPDEPNVFMGSGDPFLDSAGHDFHLAMATDPGLSLPAPFDTDYDGNPRGADGVWDRGAYEYSVPRPCDVMGGTCCDPGMICVGGRFASSTDCGLQCCLEGSCAAAMEEEPVESAENDIPGEADIDGGSDAVADDAGTGDPEEERHGDSGESGCGCAVVT